LINDFPIRSGDGDGAGVGVGVDDDGDGVACVLVLVLVVAGSGAALVLLASLMMDGYILYMDGWMDGWMALVLVLSKCNAMALLDCTQAKRVWSH
jgi:hypothetical protein